MSAVVPAVDTDFAPTLHEPRLSDLQAPPPASPEEELARGRLMQRSLCNLLDRVPGARSALPHLAALEAALGRHGAQALERVSGKVAAKMLSQLRVLPLDASDGPALDLLARVQRMVRRHSREQREHQLSPHDPLSTVIITETSESDFMEALAQARGDRGGH